jgi:hypothetical protein
MATNKLGLTAGVLVTMLVGGLAGGAESAPAAATLPETAPVPTYAERLGWPRGARVVIFHVDDAGLSPDSNQGTREALENGVATSASIMFTCPWVSPCAEYLRQHPETDTGIHLTLTAEWRSYRWGPVAGKRAVPSLVDPEGCLWPEVPAVMAHATPDEGGGQGRVNYAPTKHRLKAELQTRMVRVRSSHFSGWDCHRWSLSLTQLVPVPNATLRHNLLGADLPAHGQVIRENDFTILWFNIRHSAV